MPPLTDTQIKEIFENADTTLKIAISYYEKCNDLSDQYTQKQVLLKNDAIEIFSLFCFFDSNNEIIKDQELKKTIENTIQTFSKLEIFKPPIQYGIGGTKTSGIDRLIDLLKTTTKSLKKTLDQTKKLFERNGVEVIVGVKSNQKSTLKKITETITNLIRRKKL